MRYQCLVEETVGSIRRIRRHPRTFLYVFLILAIGLGCLIGMFDIAYGVLHAPMPCPFPDRVAVAVDAGTVSSLFSSDLPNPHLPTIFEKVAQYKLLDANLDFGEPGPRRVQLAMVSPQFFPALGIPMMAGHDFSVNDHFPIPRSQPRWLPIIISNELWHSYFASSEAILNHSIDINIYPYYFQVIGIAPPDVNFPSGVDAWVPTHLVSYSTVQTAGVPYGSGGVIGLLKPGLSITAAESAIRTWPKEGFFDGGRDAAIKLIALADFRAGEIYPLSMRLWLASIFFLLLTVVAVGTIFRAEAVVRREEFAVRNALGASPGRLFVGLSLETGLAVVAALVTSSFVRFVVIHVTTIYLSLPREFHFGISPIDLAMAAGAAGIAFVASLIVYGASVRDYLPLACVLAALRSESVESYTATHIVSRYRIPVQMIPATMITIAAALLVRSAYNGMHIDPSVNAEDVFIGEISLHSDFESFLMTRFRPTMSHKEKQKNFADSSRLFPQIMNATISEIVKRLKESSGVVEAGAISTAPYRGHSPLASGVQFSPKPSVSPTADVIDNIIVRSMTPGAIPGLGMKLLYGRNFSGNKAEDENTVIINEALLRRLGGGTSVLGQYIKHLTLPAGRIVGVVGNVHEETLHSRVWPTVYHPFTQYGVSDADLVIRMSHGVGSRGALQLIEAAVHSIAPRAAVSHFQPLKEMVESAGMLARYTAGYLFALALLSVFLAGLCASSRVLGELRRRKAEIGIRLALGATRGDIIGLFVYSDLARGGVAATLGALLAWWFLRLLRHLLYGVGTLDPMSYMIGITALIGFIAAVEVVLLRRALQKNPRDLL